MIEANAIPKSAEEFKRLILLNFSEDLEPT